ncbi:MAG: hypothetical protein ACC661_08045 [Verrucomicrobiales bacterium]
MKRTDPITIAVAAFAVAGLLAGCGDSSAPDAAGGGDAAAAPKAKAAVAPEAEAPAGSGTKMKAPAGGGGETVLTTEIPPQKIEGTPMPIKVPNLEPAAQAVPKIAVPEGTVLLSKGKPVTSSDDFPIIGELELITDGEKDAGEGYFVEVMDGLQWVQIDLEKSAAIEAIWVWHFHSQARAYHDVVVQISDDPEFADGVTTLFNNDYDNSSELGKGKDKPYVETRFGKLIDGKGTAGRYVRLYNGGNTSNSANHYIEVEVYGVPGA